MNDLKTFGFIFETMCMRDLRAYVESTGGNVSHYHDSNDLECDAVVHLYGGAYGFVQMKLGGSQEEINQAAEKMNDLYLSFRMRKGSGRKRERQIPAVSGIIELQNKKRH